MWYLSFSHILKGHIKCWGNQQAFLSKKCNTLPYQSVRYVCHFEPVPVAFKLLSAQLPPPVQGEARMPIHPSPRKTPANLMGVPHPSCSLWEQVAPPHRAFLPAAAEWLAVSMWRAHQTRSQAFPKDSLGPFGNHPWLQYVGVLGTSGRQVCFSVNKNTTSKPRAQQCQELSWPFQIKANHKGK